MFDPANIISSIFGDNYYEVAQDTPIVLKVPTTAVSVLGNTTYKWVLSYLIKVRDMGTATYIGVGNSAGQGYRMTIKGETYGYACNRNEVCDLTRVWVVSDTNDAYIEIIAAYIPTPMQNRVLIAERL